MFESIVLTHVLHDLFTRSEIPRGIAVQWLTQRTGVFIGDSHFEVPEVEPAIAFNHVEPLSGGTCHPKLTVEAHGIHNKRVAVPPADRMSHPCWVRIGRMRSSIKEDLTKTRRTFRKNHNQCTRLNEFRD